MKKITLQTSIEINGDDVTEITVRSPGAGELRGLSLAALADLEVDTVLKILPRVTSPTISEEDGESLSLIDMLKIGGSIINPNENTEGNGNTTPKA